MNINFAPMDVLPTTGTLVILVSPEGKWGSTAAMLDERCGGTLTRAIDLAGDKVKRGPIDIVCPQGVAYDRLMLFSIDDAGDTAMETLGGKMATKLASIGIQHVGVLVEPLPDLAIEEAELALALATGLRLRDYRFSKYRTASEGDETEALGEGITAATFHLDDHAAAVAAWDEKAAIAAGVEHGRDLVTEPANVLTPAAFAEHCRQLGDEVGVEVDILDRQELERLGMRALLGVAQGSANEPYVAVMRWQGGPADEPPVALIGKGVCFDTGGISLKPSGGMEEMKFDMGGAAAVFGAMKAIAGRKAKVNVVAVLGLVENMPSGTAQRPGDVVKAMSGTTIEVINTDAEGRLVLADALHYTVQHFKPKVMVDVATLTGAVIVALGHEQAGLFASEDTLAKQLIEAGDAVGERVWRLPLGPDYAKHIKSEIADIKNTGRAREAGATAGAVFLERFVGDVPWAHIDIAGVAWSKRDLPLAGKGATGFGIRLLDRFVSDHFEG